jgi:hypothetical protein
MLAEIKRRARDRMRGDPGKRFQDHYRRHAREKPGHPGAERFLNYGLAAVSLVIGAVLVVFPGPAIPFFILAGILLASESLTAARVMDWLELRFRAVWKWGKRRWDRLPHRTRVALKLLAPCCSIAAAIFTWRLLHR